MSNEQQEFMTDLFKVISHIIDYRVTELVKPLEGELKLIKSLQDEWVTTKEAMRITGVSARTLKAERERSKTLLVVIFVGESQTTPRYLRTSLLAYSESKIKKRIVGVAIPAMI
jgi:hypothetical protein